VANAWIYGTPITSAERADLGARPVSGARVEDVIRSYGDRQAGWAGEYLDISSTAGVVALFTTDVALHQGNLRGILGDAARFEVRQARWSLQQLEEFRSLIDADTGWLATIRAWYAGSGIDITNNVVLLDISSANANAPQLVARHFNNDPRLRIRSDGIGRWEGPVGSLVVVAVTSAGAPAANLDCVPMPDQAAAYRGDETAYTTGNTGICRFPAVGATGYVVELRRMDGDAWKTVGSVRVVVPPKGVGRGRVTVTDGP
jgi:hypothetical protein